MGRKELEHAFKELENQVADEIKKYYKTICPYCLEEFAKLHDCQRSFKDSTKKRGEIIFEIEI